MLDNDEDARSGVELVTLEVKSESSCFFRRAWTGEEKRDAMVESYQKVTEYCTMRKLTIRASTRNESKRAQFRSTKARPPTINHEHK